MYLQVTPDEPLREQSVRTVVSCLISIILAPVTPTVFPLCTAEAPVNVTVPKLAKVTWDPPESKSSMIHSALVSQSVPKLASLLKLWVTVFPVEVFLIIAVPPVLEVAVTVTVTTSPAENEMPLLVVNYNDTPKVNGIIPEVISVIWIPLGSLVQVQI